MNNIQRITPKRRRCSDIALIGRSKGYRSLQARDHLTLILGKDFFFLIVEDPTVTVKCRTAIQSMFPLHEFVSKCKVGVSHVHLHPYHFLLQAVPLLNLCLSVMLDNLSCSSTSISFLTTSCSFTLICV